MKREIFNVPINGIDHVVIDYQMTLKSDENGAILWADESKETAYAFKRAVQVTFYVMYSDGLRAVKIPGHTIETIASVIQGEKKKEEVIEVD